jgi:hypothetical protein
MFSGVPYHGGATWAVLQYVLGLRDLGHEVLLLETVEPERLADHKVLRYFEALLAEFDLSGRAALLGRDTRSTFGLHYREIVAAAHQADLLLNLSGMITDQSILEAVPVRVYVDLDPAFTQLWHAVCGISMPFDAHNRFVTVGLAVGSPDCPIPTCGRHWIGNLPPVALDRWPPDHDLVHDALTTVANWRGYGSIQHDGVLYGQKAHSMRRLMTLPGQTRESFLLALMIDPGEEADLRALHTNGWRLMERDALPRTPDNYQRFIQGSKAEFGVAKSGYVVSRSGWFSDRSACYLASGRPVIAEDTGFSSFLPSGDGLLAFRDLDGAAAAVEVVRSSYLKHAKAAREIAETYLDAAKVLPALIEAVA